MLDLAHGESEVGLKKCSSPNRSGDKAKRERSSPYKHPKHFATELSIKELVSDRLGGGIKFEDQVMLDGALGTSTLDVHPADPKPVRSHVQEPCSLVRAKGPSLVFLMETRRSAQRAMKLKWRLGLKNSVGVDSAGQGGGIILFWHESIEVVLLGLSPQFIDVKVKDVTLISWYRITFIYGEPHVESRHLMWETLHRLRSLSTLPWMVVGDFNEAMRGFEHFSAHQRPVW
jgi:hypothetical protein